MVFEPSPDYSDSVRRLFVSFLFFAIAGTVCAGLGDSADRIENSYGDLAARHLRDDGTVVILYHRGRYLCYVIFDHGVSVSERYFRYDQADLSEKEIAKFLKMNAGKMTWSRDDAFAPAKGRRFERSDRRAEAIVARVKDRLTLTVRVPR